MIHKPESFTGIKDYGKTTVGRFGFKGTKWGKLRKILIVSLIFFCSLFILFGISLGAVFSLPVITAIYFCTGIVKNIIDIIVNWRWGNIFSLLKNKKTDFGSSEEEKMTSQVVLFSPKNVEHVRAEEFVSEDLKGVDEHFVDTQLIDQGESVDVVGAGDEDIGTKNSENKVIKL